MIGCIDLEPWRAPCSVRALLAPQFMPPTGYAIAVAEQLRRRWRAAAAVHAVGVAATCRCCAWRATPLYATARPSFVATTAADGDEPLAAFAAKKVLFEPQLPRMRSRSSPWWINDAEVLRGPAGWR